MSHKPAIKAPLRRYGEYVGRACAGLIIIGSAGFAILAIMRDLM